MKFTSALLIALTASLSSAYAEEAANNNKDQIKDVVAQHATETRACYEKELAQKPNLAGRLNLHFTIDAEGKVSEAKISETTLNDANVEACIVDLVKTWQFPKSKEGQTVVDYPFNFSSAK